MEHVVIGGQGQRRQMQAAQGNRANPPDDFQRLISTLCLAIITPLTVDKGFDMVEGAMRNYRNPNPTFFYGYVGMSVLMFGLSLALLTKTFILGCGNRR